MLRQATTQTLRSCFMWDIFFLYETWTIETSRWYRYIFGESFYGFYLTVSVMHLYVCNKICIGSLMIPELYSSLKLILVSSKHLQNSNLFPVIVLYVIVWKSKVKSFLFLIPGMLCHNSGHRSWRGMKPGHTISINSQPHQRERDGHTTRIHKSKHKAAIKSYLKETTQLY